jgi:hypothetical protein
MIGRAKNGLIEALGKLNLNSQFTFFVDATLLFFCRFITFNQIVSNGDTVGGPSSSPFFGTSPQKQRVKWDQVTLRVHVWGRSCTSPSTAEAHQVTCFFYVLLLFLFLWIC